CPIPWYDFASSRRQNSDAWRRAPARLPLRPGSGWAVTPPSFRQLPPKWSGFSSAKGSSRRGADTWHSIPSPGWYLGPVDSRALRIRRTRWRSPISRCRAGRGRESEPQWPGRSWPLRAASRECGAFGPTRFPSGMPPAAYSCGPASGASVRCWTRRTARSGAGSVSRCRAARCERPARSGRAGLSNQPASGPGSAHFQLHVAVGDPIVCLDDPVVARVPLRSGDVLDRIADEVVVGLDGRGKHAEDFLRGLVGLVDILQGAVFRAPAGHSLDRRIHGAEQPLEIGIVGLDLAGRVVVFQEEETEGLTRVLGIVAVELVLVHEQRRPAPVDAVLVEVIGAGAEVTGALIAGE